MNKLIRNKWNLVLLSLLGLCILLINYTYISFFSDHLIFNTSTDLPKSQYALFLGTPKYLPNGNVNNYYKNRINAAVKLYTEKIVSNIIISADSLNKYNENEVAFIKSDLIERGIDESHLILDKNGNRTWKSIIHLKKYSDVKNIILISQKFHLERAIYISERENINAIGYEAKGGMSTKLWIREVLARVQMQMDLLTN